MAYTICKNHPEYFFLASYQMSPGVESKISTKNYSRVGKKNQNFLKNIKNHPLEILNLCNGLQHQSKPTPNIFSQLRISYPQVQKIKFRPKKYQGWEEVKNSISHYQPKYFSLASYKLSPGPRYHAGFDCDFRQRFFR